MSWKRKVGIGFAILFLLLAVGAAFLFFVWKPWIPPIVREAPGPTGRVVDDGDGMIANYYPGAKAGRHPAILLIGGSEGGIGKAVAKQALLLQDRGYSVLALSYFRLPGQTANLENIPLELFGRAIGWMGRQREIDPARIAVMGGSKGAEAALLVASRHPAIKAVVAGMPSSVAWQGIAWDGGDVGASWTERGRAVPTLSYGGWQWGTTDVSAIYKRALRTLPRSPDPSIPLERTTAPVLLICGRQDSLWPSCPMADRIVARARAKGRPAVTLLAYADAGHGVFGPPRRDSDIEGLGMMGGSDAGNQKARQDSWPKALAFLRAHLGE